MLTEYDHYAMPAMAMDSVCSSSSGPQDGDLAGYGLYHSVDHSVDQTPQHTPEPWQDQTHAPEDAYTLTVLSDAGGAPPPPPYMPSGPQVPWGVEPWQQHGPAHAGNPFDDHLVSGSDGSSPDRRCVRSLLHVALQKGSSFAQQFTSCGVPPLPPPPSYPVTIKQEPDTMPSPLASPGVFVSSTSCGSHGGSPRPDTPVDSLRSSYSPSSSPYPHLMHVPQMQQHHLHHEDGVVSTTTCYSASPFTPAPPPSYSAFRTPYPTPSPDPCYPPPPPQRSDPFLVGPLAPLVPLPVHLMSTTTTSPTPTPTPTSRPAGASKRRRSRKAVPVGGAATPVRKRERSERQLHPCSLCDKRFKDNYSVNVHMRTHTGEKPFPCIVCGKMFRQKAHLAKHRSTHQPSEWAAAAAHAVGDPTLAQHDAVTDGSHGVDGNSNTLPSWVESKCKAPNVWTPSVMSPPLSSVQ